MKRSSSLRRLLATIVVVVAWIYALVFVLAAINIHILGSSRYTDFFDFIVTIQVRGYWPGQELHSPTYYIARFFVIAILLETAGALSYLYLRRPQSKA